MYSASFRSRIAKGPTRYLSFSCLIFAILLLREECRGGMRAPAADAFTVYFSETPESTPKNLGPIRLQDGRTYTMSSILSGLGVHPRPGLEKGVMFVAAPPPLGFRNGLDLSVSIEEPGDLFQINLFSELRNDSILTFDGESITDVRKQGHGLFGILLKYSKDLGRIIGHAAPCWIWLDGITSGLLESGRDQKISLTAERIEAGTDSSGEAKHEVAIKAEDAKGTPLLEFQTRDLLRELSDSNLNGILLGAKTRFKDLSVRFH